MKRFVRSALGLNAVSLVHLVRSGPRSLAKAGTRAFLAARDEPRPPTYQIPAISLSQILGDRSPAVRFRVARHEDGMLPIDQLVTLLAILVAEQPAEVLEIGTFMGHTTRQMAEALESATIHTVDLPESNSPAELEAVGLPKDDFHLIGRRVVGREFKTLPIASRIRQHFGDTATWSFREAGQPTFFFIDGSHTYEYAKHDSEACYELCGGRGVFLWHDCDPTHPGVERLITEWRSLGRDVRRIGGTTLAYWKSA